MVADQLKFASGAGRIIGSAAAKGTMKIKRSYENIKVP